MTERSADAPADEQDRRQPGRTVLVRTLRATPRAFLAPAHLEQLFGSGFKPTPIWSGFLGEALCLERIVVSGGPRKEVKVRVCVSQTPHTVLVLTHAALALLDLRGAPAFGSDDTLGAAISGPKGAVVLSSGVCRAAPRLVLPEGVARKLGLIGGTLVEVGVPSAGEMVDSSLRVEVRAAVKEGIFVVDGAVADRLGEAGAQVAVRVVPVLEADAGS
jgi:hypothetical protein